MFKHLADIDEITQYYRKYLLTSDEKTYQKEIKRLQLLDKNVQKQIDKKLDSLLK